MFRFLPVFLFLIMAISHVQAEETEETSIVFLEIKNNNHIFYSDELFEIIDLFDYILIPVNRLSSHLELSLNFNIDEKILLLTHEPSGKTGKISFTNGNYSDLPEIEHKTPVLQEGEFFIAPEFLEFLTGKEFEWNIRRQELYIHVDWEIPETGEEIEEQDQKPQEFQTLDLSPTHYGKDVSLGSIHYGISGEGRWDREGDFSAFTDKNVFVHGRYNDWALSLGVSSRFIFSEPTWDTEVSLPLIRASMIDNHRIVLGDSRVTFPNTIGSKNLRGIIYSNPPYLTNKTSSRFLVKGEAKKNEWVYLYVNKEKFGKKYMEEDGEFSFKNVPLREKRTNLIHILREKPDGEIIEKTKELAGHRRILEEGISEVKFAAGAYKGTNDADFQGRLTGLRFYRAINNWSSFNLELLGREVQESEGWQPFEVGGKAGLSIRPIKNLIITSDFLFGGELKKLRGGFSGKATYTFPRGVLQSDYSYIPQKASQLSKKNPGQKLQISGEYDFSQKWSSFFRGSLNRSIEDMQFYSTLRGNLGVIYRDRWEGTNSLTGILGKGEKDVDIGFDELVRAEFNEIGAELGRRRRTSTYESRTNLRYVSSDLDLVEDSTLTEQRLDLNNSFSGRVGANTRIYNNLDFSMLWLEKDLVQGEAEINAGFRWTPNLQTFIQGTGTTQIQTDPENPENLNIGESTAGVAFRRFFPAGSSFGLKGSYNMLHYLNDSYFSLGFDLAHDWGDDKYSFNLNFETNSPVDRRETFQFSAGVGFSWKLPSQAKIELKGQRIYPNLFEEKPDHSISISYNHALGFADGEIFGKSYSRRNTHEPTVTGIVFLDKNQTGDYSEGDPVLTDIPMALGGRRERTDETGQFKFERVRPGVYPLHFDMSSLEADYSVITEEKIVEIRENENLFFYFGLTLNGSISGKVFLDRNASGTFDEGDEPLQWISLVLNSGEKTVFTRSDGSFYLENIPLGKHEIKVSNEDLPPNTGLVEDKIIVEITREKLEKGEILIPVRYGLNN